jgi:arylsulfatase A-like enzyme
MMVKWPAHINPSGVSNDIVSLQDWVPTLMAAVGQPDIKDKLLKRYSAGGKTYKVHLDGYNQLPMLQGACPLYGPSPERKAIVWWRVKRLQPYIRPL